MRKNSVDFWLNLLYNGGYMVSKNRILKWSIDREVEKARFKDYNQLYKDMYKVQKQSQKMTVREWVYTVFAMICFVGIIAAMMIVPLLLTK